jgi:hypothetical protein
MSFKGSECLTGARRAIRFAANVCGLLIGFAIGQGSVFAVQTWLVARGQFAAVASFGVAMAILSLAQWAGDWGGLILLARHDSYERQVRRVWAANIARLIVSAPLVCMLASFASFYAATDLFAAGILFGGLPVAPIWALNLSGFLDGHDKNRLSGPLSGLPWVATAIAMVFTVFSSNPSFFGGLLIGVAYSFGCATCVALQYLLARNLIAFESSWWTLSSKDVFDYLHQGAVYAFGELPSQLFGRALILIVSLSLGDQAVGIYVYIRQILGGVTQMVMFVKRVEIPRLAASLEKKPLSVSATLQAQIVNLVTSVCVTGGAVWLYHIRDLLPVQFAIITFYGALCSGVLPVWALSVTFAQAAVLRGKIKEVAIVRLSSIAVSGILTVTFTKTFGLGFIPVVDFVMNLVEIGFLVRIAHIK